MNTPKILKLLFVCDTNTTLSPLMKEIFWRELGQRKIQHRFELDSAGTHIGQFERGIERRMGLLAEQHGFDLSHHAVRAVSPADLNEKNFIFTMSESTFWDISDLAEGEEFSAQLELLLQHSGQLGIREVADPLFGEISFEDAYNLLEKASGHLGEYFQEQISLKQL
ncbi:MAG: hypothetical protein KDD70_13780 [Bdellovibrionales bacterium]|nr:hypothetical protein [Bdellovibrionales bacterium]